MADELKVCRTTTDDDGSSLPPSRLGTKEYWDEAYQKEQENFEDIGDVGEIWFGEGSMNRMIKWIKKSSRITKDSSMLDIGCGNGMLAIRLAEEGYTNVTGTDYSSGAVQLSQSIAKQEGVDIKFMECDILNLSNSSLSGHTFDVCLDKGTYDAISLNPQDSTRCRALYIKAVACLLPENGFFIITSCNWTKSELVEQFKEDFTLLDEIPSPSFSFGGQAGNTVTSLIFVKRFKST
ncbi:EEF1A lysine methyltransferase 2-like [Actinia tenebrosa]|uniref:Protein-lysine N-methyltransferase LOC116305907 n=1 Tax=Actinia tenebrosa TaxID=6105 RepID=A0A6P8J0U4_ACTTE|nr:EEF1A lysine methyltransferase 2-like [Actinia tenebrosa]